MFMGAQACDLDHCDFHDLAAKDPLPEARNPAKVDLDLTDADLFLVNCTKIDTRKEPRKMLELSGDLCTEALWRLLVLSQLGFLLRVPGTVCLGWGLHARATKPSFYS